MTILFSISLIADVFLAYAILKLTERFNELTHKVEHIEQVTDYKYNILKKHVDETHESLYIRYNRHRLFHIMKGDNLDE